jgi:hypothetical protein
MTKTQSSVFRLILFLIGAGIVALAFFLFNRGRELSAADIFTWASIGVMYVVFFMPFFFSAINTGNFSGKIPSIAIVWFGIFVYIPVSIVIIALLRFLIISLNVALVFQSVALFALLLAVYFGFFASSHAGSVAAEEADKLRPLTEIKNKSALLALKAGSLSAEYEETRKLIKKSADDIRYLSPAGGNSGAETDLKILNVIERLDEICGTVSGGGHSASFEAEAKKLQSLVMERKLLRN